MRKIVLYPLILLALLFSTHLFAQTNTTIGTGTTLLTDTEYPTPFGDWYEGSRAQFLYRASEMTAAGMLPGVITRIAFNVASLSTSGIHENYAIYIGTTTATALTATTWEPGITTPVLASTNYQPVSGVNNFTLPTPFVWDGTSNIIIEICHGDPNNASAVVFTVNAVVPVTTLTFNGSHNYRADNLGNLCGSATTTNTGNQMQRPNIIFTWIPAGLQQPTVTINPPGTPVGSSVAVCSGTTLNLTATSTVPNVTVFWSGPGGFSSVGPTINIPNISTAQGGQYQVQVTDGVDTSFPKSINVIVNQTPNPPTFTNVVTSYCKDDLFIPIAATGTNLKWYSVPTGGTATTTIPTVNTNIPGTYTWYVSQTTTGCEGDRAPLTITVATPPPPPLVEPIVYCQGDEPLQLIAGGQNLKWYTSSTGGIPSTVAPTPQTGAEGFFSYYVSQTVNGCEGPRARLDVKVVFKPNVLIQSSVEGLCAGEELKLSYYGSGLPTSTYNWGLPAGATLVSGTGQGPLTVKFDSSGIQKVTLQVGNEGCYSGIGIKNINVKPLPTGDINAAYNVCQDAIALIVLDYYSPEIDTFRWDFDGGTLIHDHQDVGPYGVRWSQPGEHIIKLTVKNEECTAILYDTVMVRPLPDASFSGVPAAAVCAGDSIKLTANNIDPASAYQWMPERFFDAYSDQSSTYARIDFMGPVSLTVTDEFGCQKTDSVMIKTENCCIVSFPSAFTPNGDGKNDVFRPVTTAHLTIKSFKVMNRWGQTVFETAEQFREWDGTMSGEPQDMGNYYYYIAYICNGITTEQKGEVTLIR